MLFTEQVTRPDHAAFSSGIVQWQAPQSVLDSATNGTSPPRREVNDD